MKILAIKRFFRVITQVKKAYLDDIEISGFFGIVLNKFKYLCSVTKRIVEISQNLPQLNWKVSLIAQLNLKLSKNIPFRQDQPN